MVLTQRRRGRRRWNVIWTLSAMFLLALWKVRNPESGMRNSQPFQCHLLEHTVYFYTFFISRNSIRITIIFSSLTFQDIEQNVSETLACCSKVSSASTYITKENKLSKQQTTRYSSIIQLLNRFQKLIWHPVSTISSLTEGWMLRYLACQSSCSAPLRLHTEKWLREINPCPFIFIKELTGYK